MSVEINFEFEDPLDLGLEDHRFAQIPNVVVVEHNVISEEMLNVLAYTPSVVAFSKTSGTLVLPFVKEPNHLWTKIYKLERKDDNTAAMFDDIFHEPPKDPTAIKVDWSSFKKIRGAATRASDMIKKGNRFDGMINPWTIMVKPIHGDYRGAKLKVQMYGHWSFMDTPHYMVRIFNQDDQDCTGDVLKDMKDRWRFLILEGDGEFAKNSERVSFKMATIKDKYLIPEDHVVVEADFSEPPPPREAVIISE